MVHMAHAFCGGVEVSELRRLVGNVCGGVFRMMRMAMMVTMTDEREHIMGVGVAGHTKR